MKHYNAFQNQFMELALRRLLSLLVLLGVMLIGVSPTGAAVSGAPSSRAPSTLAASSLAPVVQAELQTPAMTLAERAKLNQSTYVNPDLPALLHSMIRFNALDIQNGYS